MGLQSFITENSAEILAEGEAFARSLFPADAQIETSVFRDHAAQVLSAIAANMGTPQSAYQQSEKSKGHAPRATLLATSAETHGNQRASNGFDINQTTAEYRALRATVIRLWLGSAPALGPEDVIELVRFNEAMDQALAESVVFFAAEAARQRDTFLGILSHELRTPLATIIASTQAIELGEARGIKVTGASARALRGARRIESLLDDLLDYVRSGAGGGMPLRPTPLDMGLLCEQLIGEIEGSHPTRAITLERSGYLHGLWDGQRVAQAISNLIGNAIKYGAPDTPVQVRLRGIGSEGISISVSNQGPMIPASTCGTIFEPLIRGASNDQSVAGSSLGLGLYIAREIAQAHGGSVSVDSTEERTCFEILMPRRAEARDSAAFAHLRLN